MATNRSYSREGSSKSCDGPEAPREYQKHAHNTTTERLMNKVRRETFKIKLKNIKKKVTSKLTSFKMETGRENMLPIYYLY